MLSFKLLHKAPIQHTESNTQNKCLFERRKKMKKVMAPISISHPFWFYNCILGIDNHKNQPGIKF